MVRSGIALWQAHVGQQLYALCPCGHAERLPKLFLALPIEERQSVHPLPLQGRFKFSRRKDDEIDVVRYFGFFGARFIVSGNDHLRQNLEGLEVA